jgi:hypothetical protein
MGYGYRCRDIARFYDSGKREARHLGGVPMKRRNHCFIRKAHSFVGIQVKCNATHSMGQTERGRGASTRYARCHFYNDKYLAKDECVEATPESYGHGYLAMCKCCTV